MAKQNEKKVVKQSSVIADRPITMAPQESIDEGMKFFLNKCHNHMFKMQDVIFGRKK